MEGRVRSLSKTVHPARRVRVFLVAESTRHPASAVPVQVYFESTAARTGEPLKYQCGLFESDRVGYLSVPIPSPSQIVPGAEDHETPPALYIEPLATLGGRLELPYGQELFHYVVPDSLARTKAQLPAYPSVVEPDIRDWELSPASFATQTSLPIIGQDGCEQLLHNTLTEATFRYSELYREPGAPETLAIARAAPCEGGFDDITTDLCIRRGAILDYEIEWAPRGHSLGEIVYSTTLGPCEHINLAVIDWSREDAAVRSDAVEVSETLLHDLRRDRVVEETTKFAIRERQYGGSVMGAVGGALGAASFGIAGGIGGGYATTTGRRSGSARGTQMLADQVAQAASSMRSSRQTVVVEASAREQNVLQTRTVRNHNHCHALTTLYYAILRHYVVTVRVVDRGDVVLVALPFEPFSLGSLDTHRWILEPGLLDPKLAAAFDDLEGNGLSGAAADAEGSGEIARLLIETTTGSDPVSKADIYFTVTTVDGRVQRLGQLGAPGPPDEFEAGATNTFTIEAPSVRLHAIRGIGIEFRRHRGAAATWDLRGMRVRYLTTGGNELLTLYQNDQVNHHFADDGDWSTSISPIAAPENGDAAEGRGGPSRLLAHINAHRLYYNTLLWLNRDPNENARLLEQYAYTHTDSSGEELSGRLADFVDPKPVGVSGRYVAFRLDSTAIAETINTPRPVQRVVSLPTPGTFAELKLSHCSGCEKVDATRFWDWQESPCPDNAPVMAPIAQTEAQVRPDLTPGDQPGATLSVEPAPEAPALGQLLQGVLDVMKTPDIFRDMSGKEQVAGLVEAAIQGAVEANKAQIELEKAKLETDKAKTELEKLKLEKGAVDGGRPPRASAPPQIRRQTAAQQGRDAHSLVTEQERKGRISPEQAAKEHLKIGEAVRSRIAAESGSSPLAPNLGESVATLTAQCYDMTVAFSRDYGLFRRAVASNPVIRLRMIYRSNQEHPERVIDRVIDLQHVHNGYVIRETPDGAPINLEVCFVRDEQGIVHRLRFSNPDVVDFPEGSLVHVESRVDNQVAAGDAMAAIMQALIDWRASAPAPQTGDARYADSMGYLEKLQTYVNSIRLLLYTRSTSPGVQPDTLEVARTFLPRLARPIYPPNDVEGAERALEIWNVTLTAEQRRAIRFARDLNELVAQMRQHYESEYMRLGGPGRVTVPD